ncbi:porin family protein [Hymenobacter properus]|uniref:PorT family protein n=1 Tax=Hymenobacter properus TaxID=2791026 RepID=A0A931BKW7_9BACT|nr:porin family protein [Hymenobacter properus]MBF9144098.1 PorT family protein [Hymenobacter properus]MBR7722914.1 PorT family protein [Microvirga sp. SRT04]
MRLPLLSFLLLSASVGFAQKAPSDYVVTTAGDTLRGQVRQVGRHFSRVLLYRAGQASAEFTAADITAFGGAQGIESVSRTVGRNGKPQFVKPLVAGYVNLFAGENDQQEKRYYLQVPDSAYVIEVAPITNQLTLARNLAGCSTFDFGSNAFQARYPYSNAGLTKLVLDYNRCKQPQQPSRLVKHGTGVQLNVGLKGGLNLLSSDLLPETLNPTAHSRAGFQGGFMVNMATRTPLSVQAEVLYVTYRSEYGPAEATTYNSGIATNTVAATLKFSQIQIPLLVRYTLGHGAVRPFANAGFVFGNNLNNNSTYYYPKSPSTPNRTLGLTQTVFGFAGGAGLTLYRASQPFLSLEARYDRLEPSFNVNTNSEATVGLLHLLHFDAGLYF